jgi:UDP-glucose:(glucosyl)LPS alpha-1,2-glucosyltransferase
METNELSVNAMGGTELMMKRVHGTIDPVLLEQVQIIPSRVRELNPEKIRILYCHDLPDDPEASKALSRRAWANFHKIVFVSNWQMQAYITKFEIPWSKCIVIPNAIEPISRPEKLLGFNHPIRFIYHTTPHRGLNILYAVFNELCKHHQNIHLDVYSSFKIYGWQDRDEPFQEIFGQIDAHPNMTNHGTVSNDAIRLALGQADVFAYPSTWLETSCLALIEAMSAGLLCVHPNLGALFETSGSWTTMYQYNEDPNAHASWMFQILDQTLKHWNEDVMRTQINNQKSYADVFHNWTFRKPQWEQMINSLLKEPRELPEEMYVYQA